MNKNTKNTRAVSDWWQTSSRVDGWRKMADDEKDYFTRRTILISQLIAQHIPPGTTLDIGCGAGLLSQKLAEKGFDIYACDISQGMVEAARQRNANFPETHFQVAMNGGIPFDERFSLITAIGVFPYVPDYDAYLQTLLAHLNDGGYIVASCTNGFTPHVFFELRQSYLWKPEIKKKEIINLLRTGIQSGGHVDYHTAKQCHSSAAFDRLFKRNGLQKKAELDLYAVFYRLDRSPLDRSKPGKWLARHFGWNHIGMYLSSGK